MGKGLIKKVVPLLFTRKQSHFIVNYSTIIAFYLRRTSGDTERSTLYPIWH